MTLTCIHFTDGLCPACQADYDDDPSAWLEYGEHTAGITRWQELQAEMKAALAEPAPEIDWTDVPF